MCMYIYSGVAVNMAIVKIKILNIDPNINARNVKYNIT